MLFNKCCSPRLSVSAGEHKSTGYITKTANHDP